MTQTVSQAVARRNERGVQAFDLIKKYEGAFARILPANTLKPEAFTRIVLGAFRKSPQLVEATIASPDTMLVALFDAARLGLEPGTEQYYLTPRKDKGTQTVLGVVGYQGEVELAYRSGAVSAITCQVVRSNDPFRYRHGIDRVPVHEPDWFAPVEERGDLRGVYAYAELDTGKPSQVVLLGPSQIQRAIVKSEGWDKDKKQLKDWSPWKNDPEPMWQKTAMHRLRKWIPTSAEYRREAARAAAEADRAADAAGVQMPPVDRDEDATGDAPVPVRAERADRPATAKPEDDDLAEHQRHAAAGEPDPDCRYCAATFGHQQTTKEDQ